MAVFARMSVLLNRWVAILYIEYFPLVMVMYLTRVKNNTPVVDSIHAAAGCTFQQYSINYE
jgi:hypothetical protein